MAATVTRRVLPTVPGAERYTTSEVTFDSSYATGGLSVTPAQLGLTNVLWAIATIKVSGTGSVTSVFYDVPTSKILAYVAAAQVTATTDISAVTAQVVAFGN